MSSTPVTKIQEAAIYAEQVTSPDFARAVNLAHRKSPESAAEEQEITQGIMMDAISEHPKNVSPTLEMKRRAALGALAVKEYTNSPYYDYLLNLPGASGQTDNSQNNEGTENGQPDVVRTNSYIVSLQGEISDPLDFFDRSLRHISERKSSSQRTMTGPENYATAIKYFADKLVVTPEKLSVDQEQIAAKLLERWLEGYKYITTKDKPNEIEVTNLAAAIQRIPNKLLPEGISAIFVRDALDTLPRHSRRSMFALLNAASFVQADEAPMELAVLVDLSVNMLGQLEDSKELRSVLRAIANLRPSGPTDNVIKTAMNASHGIVKSMTTFSGMLQVVESLKQIIEYSTINPSLSILVKEMATDCVRTAARRIKDLQMDPSTEVTTLRRDMIIASKIGTMYQSL